MYLPLRSPWSSLGFWSGSATAAAALTEALTSAESLGIKVAGETSRRNTIRLLLVQLLLLTSIALVHSLENGQIGVLYVGCIQRSPPFREMRSDPLFAMTFVVATLRDWAGMPIQDVHRMIRMYMPRTDRVLNEGYDVIVLANANQMAVGPHIERLARGVSEGGLGLLMSGGWESFGGTGSAEPPWGDTAIGRLLPTNDIIGVWDQSGRPTIDKPDHEYIRSIPWGINDPEFMWPVRWHHNPVTLKPGANRLAHVKSDQGRDDPLMITWDIEGNRVFALTSEIHTLSWYGKPWEYAVDMGSNLMIYLDDRPVPQDIALVHAARAKMFEVETRRSLLINLLDFCESFGANTQKVRSSFDDIDEIIAAGLPEYLDLRFEDTLGTYREAEELLTEAENEALRVKNRTLMWVYLIEWLAVTGTTMACGFVLWSVMVRRKLYREVRSTRFNEF